jgi:hypothetical protein
MFANGMFKGDGMSAKEIACMLRDGICAEKIFYKSTEAVACLLRRWYVS